MFRRLTSSAERPDRYRIGVGLAASLLLGLYLAPFTSLVMAASSSLGVVLRPVVLRAATHSLLSATATTLIALVLGVPLAYALARAEFRFKALVTTCIAIPLVIPPIVGGILLLSVFGPAGVGGALDLAMTRSLPGVVLAQLFVASPFTVIVAKAAFERVDPALEEAARSLGSGPVRAFRRVTLPLAKRGVVAGATLTFGRAIGEFGATLMMAYYPRTLPVQIWVTFTARGLDSAFPVALLLVGQAVAVLVLLNSLGADPWR